MANGQVCRSILILKQRLSIFAPFTSELSLNYNQSLRLAAIQLPQQGITANHSGLGGSGSLKGAIGETLESVTKDT
jgi:hypothetical protein